MDASKFVVVDPTLPVQKKATDIDWSLCILCQKSTNEKLIVPEKNPRSDKYEGYRSLSSVLISLQDIGELSSLPFQVNLSSLNDGSGVYETLKNKNAVYHKSCKSRCSDRELARARKRIQLQPTEVSPVKTRRVSDAFDENKCIFCDKPGTWKKALCKVSTVNASDKIRKYAVLLKDTILMAKISGAHDLMALEACYHQTCLTLFGNRIRMYKNAQESGGDDAGPVMSELHAYALVNLVSQIEDVREATSTGLPVFRMIDLAKYYEGFMKEMGVEHTAHTSRLRDRILDACPYLQATGAAGQDTLITYREDVDVSLRAAVRDFQLEAFRFADIAKVIRKDIFSQEERDWEGLMDHQADSTPLSLKTLIKMIMRGPGSVASTADEQAEFDQVVNSIAQLISFHTTKRVSAAASVRRHVKEREKPVPVYLAMKIYGESRSKSLINITHKLGLSISYDRLQAILNEKAVAVCNRYSQQKVVCPSNLLKQDFTIGAVDNIDHDTSSYTAKSSFHGTAISLMQFPDPSAPGAPQDMAPSLCNTSQRTLELPSEYAIVKPCFLSEKSVKIPPTEKCFVTEDQDICPVKLEREWLNTHRSPADHLPWSVFHSRAEDTGQKSITRTAVLPLFSEEAHSMAMMMHAMEAVSSAIKYINPGQTPVLVVDQPLYALCKSVQFLRPDSYGDDGIFVMMGSLHIEMASLRALGTLLENSGWVGALVHAEVTTKGRAESMLRASHVTRTRYAHQVTAAVLHVLQLTAYEEYIQNGAEDDPVTLSFDDWYEEKSNSVPQFKYWDLVMRLELTVLQQVRAIRLADFELYKQALGLIVSWFFALDQVHYARWLSVHIRDLVNLEEKHPMIAEKFAAGYFVARKTLRNFSAIGLDQNHEQVNATLKGNGGMIGLTENPESLRKLLLTIPELAHLVSKFEDANFESSEDKSTHHSDKSSFIRLFQHDFESLKSTFMAWGNPFSEDGKELYNIESKVMAPQKASEIVKNIENIGKTQYQNFVRERLESSQKLVTHPIAQNKLKIWTTKKKSCAQEKGAAKLRGLQNDCQLFRKLSIACQARQGELDEFFKYENQPCPPSLSLLGQIRTVGKSDIIRCLTNTTEEAVHSPEIPLPAFDAKIYDGPAIVHMLPPGPARTFQEYAEKIFCPYLVRECSPGVKRIDVIWDTYSLTSLKNATREKRGTGERVLVTAATKIPRKPWASFLREAQNKVQLFKLLAESLRNLMVPGVEFYSTFENSVVSSNSLADLSGIAPCNHEEADTRIILHVADAARKGLHNCMIRTTDSDVLVLAVSHARTIPGLESLWVSIGTGQHIILVAANSISNHLGPAKSAALPVFHALTGCDTVSSFLFKGKKSAFEAWDASIDATAGFQAIRRGELDEGFPLVEKFVVTLYDRSSQTTSVNQCRRQLFTKKGRSPEALPPSQDALRLHCLRASYQGGQVWGQCLVPLQELPDPSVWGWKRSAEGASVYWEPVWTTLPQVQDTLVVLVKCGCRKGCTTSRCKCKKAGLPCTELCECGGECALEDH